MDKKEVFEIIRTLRKKHGISLGEIEDIQQTESEKLSSIENIFDMSNQFDVDLLVCLIYLLNDEPDNLYEWFKTTHSDCKYLSSPKKTSIPAEDYRLLIAAFVQNPLFFSMAWNWNIFNKESLAYSVVGSTKQTKNDTNNKNILLFKDFKDIKKSIIKNIDYDILVAAASKSGFNNITKIPVDLLGEIEILGNRETKRLLFTLFLNPEAYNLKFELTIDFEVQGAYKTVVLRKDSETESREVNSMPIHIDFTNGFKLRKITWNCL